MSLVQTNYNLYCNASEIPDNKDLFSTNFPFLKRFFFSDSNNGRGHICKTDVCPRASCFFPSFPPTLSLSSLFHSPFRKEQASLFPSLDHPHADLPCCSEGRNKEMSLLTDGFCRLYITYILHTIKTINPPLQKKRASK